MRIMRLREYVRQDQLLRDCITLKNDHVLNIQKIKIIEN